MSVKIEKLQALWKQKQTKKDRKVTKLKNTEKDTNNNTTKPKEETKIKLQIKALLYIIVFF